LARQSSAIVGRGAVDDGIEGRTNLQRIYNEPPTEEVLESEGSAGGGVLGEGIGATASKFG
jgi:hypothetical protein